MPIDERTSALDDPWRFKSVLWAVPIESAYAEREALLHFGLPGRVRGYCVAGAQGSDSGRLPGQAASRSPWCVDVTRQKARSINWQACVGSKGDSDERMMSSRWKSRAAVVLPHQHEHFQISDSTFRWAYQPYWASHVNPLTAKV